MMTEDQIMRWQLERKNYYDDLGLIHQDINCGTRREQFNAKATVRRKIVIGELLPINEEQCIICKGVAENWHHYISYRKENYSDVVPMCITCHANLHNMVKNYIFYYLPIVNDLEILRNIYGYIPVSELTKIFGIKHMKSVLSRNNFSFMGCENSPHRRKTDSSDHQAIVDAVINNPQLTVSDLCEMFNSGKSRICGILFRNNISIKELRNI